MNIFEHLSTKIFSFILVAFLLVMGGAVYYKQETSTPIKSVSDSITTKDRWKEILTPEQYHILLG